MTEEIKTIIAIIQRGGASLTGCVREAENFAAESGAINITSCTVTGSDERGWLVTLQASNTLTRTRAT